MRGVSVQRVGGARDGGVRRSGAPVVVGVGDGARRVLPTRASASVSENGGSGGLWASNEQ